MKQPSYEEISSTAAGSSDGNSELPSSDEIDEEADVFGRYDIARNGNGQDQPVSKEQLYLIQELYARVASYREALPAHDADFCDLDTCRRYLVARQWSLEKAEAQLVSTLVWRKERDPAGMEFWQSPKALENPLALGLRIVGWDAEGRPISYHRFGEAHDRFDADANIEHLLLLLEANVKILKGRRQQGLNQTADTRQCVWVADFDGFGFRDQNPRSAIMTAQLLQHYPELLHVVVLIDAPMMFNGLWKLVAPLLDDRVRSKVMFVKGKNAQSLLRERLGLEAAGWLANETKDCDNKKADAKKGNPKRYWIPPERSDEHDARGISSYVKSDLYIKTPGDAFEEAKRGSNKVTEKPKTRSSREEEESLTRTMTPPVFAKSLYSGSF